VKGKVQRPDGSFMNISLCDVLYVSHFPINLLSDDTVFVGMHITRDRINRRIFLHQKPFTEEFLKSFHMDQSSPFTTPLDPKTSFRRYTSPQDGMINIPYRQGVGKLNWLMIVSRPDLAFAVQQLSKYLQYSGPEHWTALKRRILRYLRGTSTHGLLLDSSVISSPFPIGFSDASFGDDNHDGKST
jgi:hypothetical protein